MSGTWIPGQQKGGRAWELRPGPGPTTHLRGHVDSEHRPLVGGQGLQNALGDGGLPSPHRTRQQDGVLAGHQGAHQVVVANSVDSGHHDLIEGGAGG